jgi:Ca2+-transporting ATPase
MTTTKSFQGLTTAEARARQARYGKNALTAPKKVSLAGKLLHILAEPMFLLLLIAALIYFLLGEARDGAIMLIFVVSMIGIDVFQEWKTDKTLAALKELAAPQATVIRDGREQQIPSADLVPGDILLLQEGVKIPADGSILQCADFCVDESSLTGEAAGVWKKPRLEAPAGRETALATGSTGSSVTVSAGNSTAANITAVTENTAAASDYWRQDYCYAGTLVTQGSAVVEVTQIGAASEYGKIGAGIVATVPAATPLQKQTNQLIRACSILAGVLFILVGIFTWLDIPDHNFKDRLIESVLSGVTLAMAMIPEEFPVILTVFLSMGAWRLARKNSLVRRLPSVETLGAVSVLCVDKTGTITLNKMSVQATWLAAGTERDLALVLGRACESETYDPMEKAMLAWCEAQGLTPPQLFAQPLVHEYAFTNELKMMGHVWQLPQGLLLAMKGSPERVLPLCDLTTSQRAAAETRLQELAAQGLRVIAVASAQPKNVAALPAELSGYSLKLQGLVALADPPRPGVAEDIAVCRAAGIRVVMITGDNGTTAAAIAGQIGIPGSGRILTGAQLDALDDAALQEAVRTTTIFSRVIPAHKMRIVSALQQSGAIVAMTGDGVNDAPALKRADIGIAMGKRGSEVSREAADLILLDDNFHTIVATVRDGRRIYDNIRKAVGYVFTIHIPVAGASLLAPFLGVAPAALLLLPLHVVLLEIIIDPTCSIVLERQPAEKEIMSRPPRNPEAKILTAALLAKSIGQGLAIFAASFGAYYYTLAGSELNAPVARSLGLAVIMLANLFLVQVNSSEEELALQSVQRLAQDQVMWAVVVGTLLLLAVILYSPLALYLKLAPLSAAQLGGACALAFISVAWYELVKLWRR